MPVDPREYRHVEPTHVNASGITCVRCGYDLSGAAVGGVCPECGLTVDQSLRVRRTSSDSASGKAITGLVLGILGLTACGLLGIVSIWLYYDVRRDWEVQLESDSSLTMAKVGMILGVISLILLAIGGCLFIGVAGLG